MDPNQNPISNQQPPVAQQPINPAGGAKEAPKMPGNEYVAPSTPEIVLPQEVQEAGVEVQSSLPSIPQDAEQAGVRHTKEATPVQGMAPEALNIQTPRSVLVHLKNVHKNVKDSLTWLVRLIMREQDKNSLEDR